MKFSLISVSIAALIISTQATSVRAQDCSVRPRLISVTGTAEINVAPDEAILNLGIESRDKALAIAKSENDGVVNKIIAVARTTGVDSKDIKTSALQMSPQYSEEKVPRFLAYVVSQSIQLTLKDVSKYEGLVTKLLEAGVNRIDGVEFLVAETRKYKDEARLKAIRAAKEKAVAMAAELDQTIGKPWDVREDSFSASSVQVNANAFAFHGERTDESTVAPGQVAIRASVSVSFQLE